MTQQKQNKTSPLSHRLDPDMKEKLQRLADADRRSLTSYIELVLEDHIEKIERAKKRRA
jgi:predicted transcriptional regulator